MKMTHTNKAKRTKGMTLLELTVVILVLLSLISVLFIGARAWKKGSDRAACILNIRNTQQAVRSYMNMNPNAAAPASSLIFEGDNAFMKAPTCPEDTTKTFATSYTYDVTDVAPGQVFLTCLVNGETHKPDNSDSW
jgi:type II secretory pathway pseudopilin PulG